jgi:hypothetical protein
MPQKMGNFERIAPGEFSNKMVKAIQNYKINTSKFYA